MDYEHMNSYVNKHVLYLFSQDWKILYIMVYTFYFNGIPQLDDIASFSFVSAKTHECCKIGVYHYVWFFQKMKTLRIFLWMQMNERLIKTRYSRCNHNICGDDFNRNNNYTPAQTKTVMRKIKTMVKSVMFWMDIINKAIILMCRGCLIIL